MQQSNPILHAEIDGLQNAGRMGQYRSTQLYSTLMPCYLCAGAIVQFGIKTVIAGESATFPGAQAFMESHGVQVILTHAEVIATSPNTPNCTAPD